MIYFLLSKYVPAIIYLFKLNNRNTRKRCEICSKLTVKTPERNHWHRSAIFVVNFEHILHLFSSISIVDFEQLNMMPPPTAISKGSFAISSNYFPLRHLMMIPMSRLANKLKIALSQANMTLMPCLYLYSALLDGSHSFLNLISPKIWAANPTRPEINTLLV